MFPGAKEESRRALVPRHALMGNVAIAVLAGITILLGVQQYLTYAGLAKTDRLDAEQYTLHFVAFLCLVTSAIVFTLLRGLHLNPSTPPGSDSTEEHLMTS